MGRLVLLKNKYDKVGNPAFYDNERDLLEAINSYFENPPNKRKVVTKEGHEYEVPVYTIAGLAYHLGFASRQSIYHYIRKGKDKNLGRLLERAKLFIESDYEMSLRDGNASGAIFALKNMGWKDKTEVDTQHKFQAMPTVQSGGKPIDVDFGKKMVEADVDEDE